MIEYLKNKNDRFDILYQDGYIVKYNSSILYDKKQNVYKLIIDNVDSSHIFISYDVASIRYILNMNIPYIKCIIVLKPEGMYLYIMREGKSNLWIVCEDFMYTQNINKYLLNILRREINYENVRSIKKFQR